MANKLLLGESLNRGQSLTSTNGQFRLDLQEDGNLVLYRSEDGQVLWATNTDGADSSQLIYQIDGNLVPYGANGAVLWVSNTFSTTLGVAVVSDCGNFEVLVLSAISY